MKSFSMHSDGIAYKAKRMIRKSAAELLRKAKEGKHNAVVYVKEPLLGKNCYF